MEIFIVTAAVILRQRADERLADSLPQGATRIL